ncbi:hypothetical protein [Rubellicoccus peritrichatus]|uniref:Uncharacterized protein n=1 Tax=Rubellicoccus peritrichatus TaxID=3080537 RepID=A0AAQ3L5W3_9BACT|nr:hypothetical protein [Puniceicoccus sp. CR14]WOO40034.1 hypothetical protein RZN69_15530 [Puniceicoccus sp. CR14]
MNKLKYYYRRISLREKILLSGFLWVIVFIWFVFSIDGIKEVKNEWAKWSGLLRGQEALLKTGPLVDAQLQESLQRFNPERTFDSESLVGRIDGLARQTGVNHDISTPRTQQGDKFEFHTMRVTIRKTPIDKWLAFADKLREESPYINLESVRISADKRNPELLDGQFVLKSFELKNITD